MEGSEVWMPQIRRQSVVSDVQSTWDPIWKEEEPLSEQIKRNEDGSVGKIVNLANSNDPEPVSAGANEALRAGLNKLAEESGSDMDTGDSSDDSLSSADSEESSRVIPPEPPSSSRSTPLFPRSAAFDSARDFFESCQRLLLAQYGYRTNKLAEVHDGVWFPNFDKTNWHHNHDSALLEPKRKPSQESESESENGDDGSSESEEEPLAQQIAKSHLRWETDAKSKRFLSVFSRRETIFAKQRSLASSRRQHPSREIVATELENLPIPENSPVATYAYEHAKYLEFTKATQIPPYPVTHPLISLYLSYRGSLGTGTLSYPRAWLNRLYRLTADEWENDPTYLELEGIEGAEEGIREYIRERSTSNSTSRPLKGNSVSSQAPARNVASESEDGSYQSDDSDNNNRRSHRRRDSQSSSFSDTSDEESSSNPSTSDASDSENQSQVGELSSSQRRFRRGPLRPPAPGETTIPGMPLVGQYFSSTSEAYKLCSRVSLLAIGINVVLMDSVSGSYRIKCARYHSRYADDPSGSCNFYIRLNPRGDGWIVAADSIFVHNHEAAPERNSDPNWMPQIRNPLARDALGLKRLTQEDDHHSPKKSKLDDAQKRHQSGKPEGKRREKEHGRDKSKAERKAKRQQEAKIQGMNVHSTLNAQERLHPAPVKQTFPQPQVGQQRTQPQIDSHSFLPSLSSFLSTLHPSLVSLARPLFESGIDSLDTLGCFVSFEPSTLQRFTDELKKRHQLSNVHVILLHQTLAAARISRSQSQP
ncbi:hypothetical protein JCM3765_001474 [Sporobolomyces pararoseus]